MENVSEELNSWSRIGVARRVPEKDQVPSPLEGRLARANDLEQQIVVRAHTEDLGIFIDESVQAYSSLFF